VVKRPNKHSSSASKGYRHLYPFKSHFLNIGGLRYHYIDEGHGEPVLMVHGNPTWSFFYRNLVKGLSKKFRCIVPDHMGCGLSDKPDETAYDFRLKSRIHDLESLIEHLHLQRFNLIVHDWGGPIGLSYAVNHPGRINRLVIMNTAGFFPPDGKPLPARLRIVRNLATMSRPLVLGLNLFARAALYMAPKKGLSKDVKSGLIAPYNNWNNRLATFKFVLDIPLHPGDPSYSIIESIDRNLSTLKNIPMLILWGEKDFVFDIDYFNQWRNRFSNAEYHCFKDAGHYLLEDVGEDIFQMVYDFLKRKGLGRK
jgi:haloalkane dehalogenase